MAFTPFYTVPAAAGSLHWHLQKQETRFLGGTSQVILGRVEKRDSGGWEGLFQLSTGLNKGHWDSPMQLSLLPSTCPCWCQQQSSLLPSPELAGAATGLGDSHPVPPACPGITMKMMLMIAGAISSPPAPAGPQNQGVTPLVPTTGQAGAQSWRLLQPRDEHLGGAELS